MLQGLRRQRIVTSLQREPGRFREKRSVLCVLELERHIKEMLHGG